MPEKTSGWPRGTGCAGQFLVTANWGCVIVGHSAVAVATRLLPVQRPVPVAVLFLGLPLASVAVLVTMVVPNGNVLPLGGVLIRFVTLQLSVALTVKVTLLRLHPPASASNTRFVGHAITGF